MKKIAIVLLCVALLSACTQTSVSENSSADSSAKTSSANESLSLENSSMEDSSVLTVPFTQLDGTLLEETISLTVPLPDGMYIFENTVHRAEGSSHYLKDGSSTALENTDITDMTFHALHVGDGFEEELKKMYHFGADDELRHLILGSYHTIQISLRGEKATQLREQNPTLYDEVCTYYLFYTQDTVLRVDVPLPADNADEVTDTCENILSSILPVAPVPDVRIFDGKTETTITVPYLNRDGSSQNRTVSVSLTPFADFYVDQNVLRRTKVNDPYIFDDDQLYHVKNGDIAEAEIYALDNSPTLKQELNEQYKEYLDVVFPDTVINGEPYHPNYLDEMTVGNFDVLRYSLHDPFVFSGLDMNRRTTVYYLFGQSDTVLVVVLHGPVTEQKGRPCLTSTVRTETMIESMKIL